MTMNRPGPLRRCLESLAAQTMPRESFEVILVDASDRPVGDVATDFEPRLDIVHHPTPNLGVSGNRNTGVALAHAPVVAFLDDDCVAGPGWLERLTAEVEARPDCLAGGRVENAQPENAVAVAGQVIAEGVDSLLQPARRPDALLARPQRRRSPATATSRSAAAIPASGVSAPRTATSPIAGGSPAAASRAARTRSSATSTAPPSPGSCASTSTTAAARGATTACGGAGTAAG